MIFTSNFRLHKNDDTGVSIAGQSPYDFCGRYYLDLVPAKQIVTRYKRTGDIDAYITAYSADVLAKLDPVEVYKDLDGTVMLCWEEPGEFCHRRLVAQWLEGANRFAEVPELIALDTTVPATIGNAVANTMPKFVGNYPVQLEVHTNDTVSLVISDPKGSARFRWYLSTLLVSSVNELILNFGQNWRVSGMLGVYAEIKRRFSKFMEK